MIIIDRETGYRFLDPEQIEAIGVDCSNCLFEVTYGTNKDPDAPFMAVILTIVRHALYGQTSDCVSIAMTAKPPSLKGALLDVEDLAQAIDGDYAGSLIQYIGLAANKVWSPNTKIRLIREDSGVAGEMQIGDQCFSFSMPLKFFLAFDA